MKALLAIPAIWYAYDLITGVLNTRNYTPETIDAIADATVARRNLYWGPLDEATESRLRAKIARRPHRYDRR